MKFLFGTVLVAALASSAALPIGAATISRGTALAMPAAAPDAGGGAYCLSTGGVAEHRIPVYGTNNPPAKQLVLAGSAEFCEYTKKSDGSRIHLLLTTLVAEKPTLAALAYYAKVKPGTCPGGANPASCYCTYLGGSDQFGGVNLAGGAWVGKGIDVDLEACIFPDLSSIDSWGLFYHSAGIVRGIDLAKVLKYHR